jgi:hypothetical protein
MAKRIHVSRIDPPVFDTTKFEVAGNLPTLETVNQTVADVTGAKPLEQTTTTTQTVIEKPIEKPVEKVIEKPEKTPSVVKAPKTEKPPKTTTSKAEKETAKIAIERGRDARGALNRVGITALVDRDLLQKTKIWAVQNGLSMSDIVNDALAVYLKSKA